MFEEILGRCEVPLRGPVAPQIKHAVANGRLAFVDAKYSERLALLQRFEPSLESLVGNGVLKCNDLTVVQLVVRRGKCVVVRVRQRVVRGIPGLHNQVDRETGLVYFASVYFG